MTASRNIWPRAGDLSLRLNGHLPERPEHGCWIFRGAITKEGYGRLWVNKIRWFAHRFSWTIANGPIHEGKWVLHRCNVPACVRPDHLFLGDHRDNMADMARKGRAAKGDRHGMHIHPESRATGHRNGAYTHPEKRVRIHGEDNVNSKLTDDQVRLIRERYWGARPSRKRYARGRMTQREIALEFGLCQATVYRIIHLETWTHL